jgi:acetyl/propionyl-CoA carboxylase alpha subunit
VNPGSMKALVKHPFAPELDQALRAIDPSIPVARETVEDVIERELKYGPVVDEESEGLLERRLSCVELMRPFDSVLVHARGCTAAKIIRKIQEAGKRVILVQSDPDMESVAADALRDGQDQLVCIGGNTPDESYLNAMSIVRIAEREGAEALHPGIGFLSESPRFAKLCRAHRINFIGPPVESMQLMGNKSNAINTAIKLEVPVVPGSFGVVTSPQIAARVADDIGYPVIIKAVYGGGGKGIAVVEDPADFHDAFLQISAEARSAFGNSDVYLEKLITSLRHVEVQILRDTHGNTKVLGLRDCSVQRNNQKIIEESGSTLLTGKLEKTLYASAAKIADAVNYVGAGTVEFIYDLDGKAVYFMEMNTRLQIEHPVTEMVSGVDIVAEQLRIAAGESIADVEPRPDGYAIEVRITAEKASVDADGTLAFLPSPGEILDYDFPEEDGFQVLSAVARGKTVSPYYDSMIVQLICKGADREDTCQRLLDYLDRAVITGVCTNIPLLKRMLADKVFRSGKYDTTFIKGFMERIDISEAIAEIEASCAVSVQAVDLDTLRIEDSDELKVLAPGPGVCYLTPNPSEPEYVEPGQVVSVDDTLCLLEAMKLFRPLTLASFNADGKEVYADDTRYEVVRIVPANGQAVNKDDLLFVIQPARD